MASSIAGYSNDLVACLEDLRVKREELNRSIMRDEEEKARIQKDLTALTERLGNLNASLARGINTRNEFDAAIGETEGAYMKILESSQTLLTVLKREAVRAHSSFAHPQRRTCWSWLLVSRWKICRVRLSERLC